MIRTRRLTMNILNPISSCKAMERRLKTGHLMRFSVAHVRLMMEMPLVQVILQLFLFLILPPATLAQEQRRLIDANMVPDKGDSVRDFVPSGWIIERELTPDLNGDSRPDVLLILIEDLPKLIGNRPNTRYRTMLILFREHNGALRRVALARRLLQCSTCAGMLSSFGDAEPNIQITKQVISVNWLRGSRDSVEVTLCLKYNAKLKQIALISEKIEKVDRATGKSMKIGSDFLTGLQTINGSKKKIARSQTSIEDIDYEKY